ncbi:tyrosine-type recombinase/integrase [Blastococcus brunescens]|uniref:Tyrosine-type recombinase/integrase n=1 Tax=Blastococcus brunescens TaxID=1564165 RepID=A0ABZ1B3M4_9ACTN|nr:tyrosine-type recombinase/integrase [Blastococcus sp. BMG 8361]WRL65411.1 tyrosine-type recombinase/integrase [Blastococcus sp. BMG 8361]
MLDLFECETCDRTGYWPDEDGSLQGRGRRATHPLRGGSWSKVTSHTFRKSVATRLDEAGLSPRQVADQLGHANPSMTLDVYFGR